MNLTNIAFLQQRPRKAGSQHSLARLLTALNQRDFEPVLLTGESGWLTRYCRDHGIRCLVESFPSSRSWLGRLYRNRQFGRRVGEALTEEGLIPPIVVGNNHDEGLLTGQLARRIDCPGAVIIRQPRMSGREFYKYGCDELDLLVAVSDYMREKVESWNPSRAVHVVENGLFEDEFYPPLSPPESWPETILVFGNTDPRKGWEDLLAALGGHEFVARPEQHEFTFTAEGPGRLADRFGALSDRGYRMNFVGRVDDFRGLIRRHDLVLNVSREESFGMSALETIAAGVPLVSSRTGVIPTVLDDELLFDPADPEGLADRLRPLFHGGSERFPDMQPSRDRLRERYPMEKTVRGYLTLFRELLSG